MILDPLQQRTGQVHLVGLHHLSGSPLGSAQRHQLGKGRGTSLGPLNEERSLVTRLSRALA